ncbi:TetR/AcrR family transcriptional regulator [Nocardia carnea]|uniref:TetR/AcrR family transcriptional regulator n=1 Tax=Nocardia carnea TaxID=37328 RepID=UPI0024590F4A|nr:TetR/AcrR family transcriptional regulator [Nocardia carnea]
MTTRTGRPPRLSRAQILTAAGELIDKDGADALTMRRLAARLGVTPMAVYHHVRNKEELLLLLLDEVAAGIRRPELPENPRERVVLAARAMHDTLVQVPWAVEVLTADDLLSPAALWYPEQIIDGAVVCGLSTEDAVHAYRTIWYYTAGEILVRAAASRRRAADDRATMRDRIFGSLDRSEWPRLATVADRWAELTEADIYERGLRALIDGLLTDH